MIRKVFILGRPGSGKSSAARYMTGIAEARGLSAVHLNDYSILREMLQADTEHKQFRPTLNNGFDVLDFSVLDTALHKLEEKVTEQSSTTSTDLFIIEFARDDHCKALNEFNSSFLQGSYVLFIDADVDTCLERIHQRVFHPTTEDDHPSLSDDLFRIYYGKEDACAFSSRFQRDYHHMGLHMKIINSQGSWEGFIRKVGRFTTAVLENRDSTPVLYRIASSCLKRLRDKILSWLPLGQRSSHSNDAPQVSMPAPPLTMTKV